MKQNELKRRFHLSDLQRETLAALHQTYYDEALKCLTVGANLAASIFMAALLETGLIHSIVRQIENLSEIPKLEGLSKHHILKWSLAELSKVAVQLGLIEDFVITKGKSKIFATPHLWLNQLRETRNLIHPGGVARGQLNYIVSDDDLEHLNSILCRLQILLRASGT